MNHYTQLSIAFILIAVTVSFVYYMKQDIEYFSDYKDSAYTKQVALLSKKYDPYSSKKRPISELVKNTKISESNQCFVNFYSLGCRYPGFLGPANNGYWNPDIAIQLAVNSGCRTFIFDIDYITNCDNLYPRMVVRNSKGISIIKDDVLCNDATNSNIKEVCDKINFYAFSSCENKKDPVVIVLYFLQKPPGENNSITVLNYYSEVAKALSPFKNRLLDSDVNNGVFYRQKQENMLLINNITDYNGKVLIFSNANTSGFRESPIKYSSYEDLDFLVNLRLQYTQTQLGITEKGTGAGILEVASNFMNIPSDQLQSTVQHITKNWTLCLSTEQIDKDTYGKITNTYGVHCIPTTIFDDNTFMYSKDLFEIYSFIPKPDKLCYKKPAKVIASEPNPANVKLLPIGVP